MSTAVATKPNGLAPPQERDVIEFKPFMSEATIKLSVAIVQHHICVPTKSGKLCNASQAIKFMMLCRARQLNPFEGDAFLIGYDTKDGPQFSLITAHQAFLKRAETHPEYDGMESGVIVRDSDGNVVDRPGDFAFDEDTLLGGWATVYFKTRKHEMRKRAKLHTYRKTFGRWLDDPAGMIVKVVEADALRSSFPSLLGGMYLDDELPQVIEATATPVAAPVGKTKSDRLAARMAPAENSDEPFMHPEPEEVAAEAAPGQVLTAGELASHAERLGCPEGMCQGFAETALENHGDDPAKWLDTKPWLGGKKQRELTQ